MRLDADAASAAVPLREAKQQRPPGCGRCMLRPRTVAPWASGRPPRRLIAAIVGGRGPALLLPPTGTRARAADGTPTRPSKRQPRRHGRY